MVTCSNWGERTGGDHCQWYRFSMVWGIQARHRKADKLANKEAEIAAREQAVREAEKQAKQEAELAARERAARETEETKKAREAEEAQRIREAEKQARQETEMAAKQRAEREAEEAKRTRQGLGKPAAGFWKSKHPPLQPSFFGLK